MAAASPVRNPSAFAAAPPVGQPPSVSATKKDGGARPVASVTKGHAPGLDGDCIGVPPGGCQIGDLFKLLSQAHMLDLLHTLIREGRPMRFVELQDRLGLSPNTLSARLKSLADAGLVSRTAFQTIPPRVDYQATAKAKDLKTVFAALWEWTQRHDLAPMPLPVAA